MESETAYFSRANQTLSHDPRKHPDADPTISFDAREAYICANRIDNLIEDLQEMLFTSGSRLRAVSDTSSAPAPPESLATMVRGTRQRLNTLEDALRKILERL